MSRSILAAFLFLHAATGAAQAPPPETGWREVLTAAVRRATERNPRVLEAEARAEEARHRVPQAAALPDPEVELGLKDAPVSHPSLTRDDFTMEMLTARQRLPGRGKRAAERAAAQADVEGTAAMREREAVEIAADTADAFFQLAAIDRGLALLEDARRRLEDAAASATEGYKVGKAGQADVLQANLETTSLEEQLSSLRAERRAQAARFNTLQGLPAGAPVSPIPSIEPSGPVGPGSWVPDAAELTRRASERSPAVRAAQAEVHRAEQELELARLEGRPDWTLMGYYGHREQFEDLAGVSASINLPWAHRRRLAERRAEKESALAAARAGVETARNQLQGEIEMAFADLGKNLEQARLYRDSILPQADINYRAVREAYAVGKIDFSTLARAANNLTFYQREAAVRAAGAGRALAALQRASGLPLLAGPPGEGGSDGEK
ncbi:MAG TPA: TolC family protein [Thermoanaerobaculia bacterium]|jgi:outer membrane protein TolC|nr:TolC family protein [Thermoanaerobaculia bacterium]